MLDSPRRHPSPRDRPLAKALLLIALLASGAGAAQGLDPDLTAVLALEGDATRGADAYAACAVCHGAQGAGRPDGTFPRIAGQHPEVVAKQLVDIRSGRRRNPVMEPHADALLDAQELADVVAYVATLRVTEPPGRGPGDDLARGKRLYRRDCASCHGMAGDGDGPAFVPALAGQHYAYLERQIRAIAAERRGNGHTDMERTVRAYSDPQLRAVVDYAGRLPGIPSP